MQLLSDPMTDRYLSEDLTAHDILSLNLVNSRNLLDSLSDQTTGGISQILYKEF